MKNLSTGSISHEFFIGCSLNNYARINCRYKSGISRENISLHVRVVIGILKQQPLRIYEKIKYRGAVEPIDIEDGPVFIIGHWRSGTSYLEHLLSSSGNFGYARYFQNQFPFFVSQLSDKSSYIHSIFKNIVVKRPQDNVVFDFDSPSEEEFAIAKSTPYSFIHAWVFRDQWEIIEKKYLLMDGLTCDEAESWRRFYLNYVKKIYSLNERKILLLKSPYNTGRLKYVLEVFPRAKFVYVYRNPVDTIVSTFNMLKTFSKYAITDISDKDLISNILSTYSSMIQRYENQKRLIPAGCLCEVKYEDFSNHPEEVLSRIYSELGLPGAAVPSDTNEYIDSQRSYKKNNHSLGEDVLREVKDKTKNEAASMGYTYECIDKYVS